MLLVLGLLNGTPLPKTVTRGRQATFRLSLSLFFSLVLLLFLGGEEGAAPIRLRLLLFVLVLGLGAAAVVDAG